MADRFTDACLTTVTDPALRALPLIGGVDQVADSTDVLQVPQTYRKLATLYTRQQPDVHDDIADDLAP